tara:strand:+ start:209 stop:865 length:657 start_codon:yes stop_codon:yes gene_type:complete
MKSNLVTSKNEKLLKKPTTIVEDPFWYDHIEILFQKNRINEFFPTHDMSIEENLNSLVRLSIYVSITLSIYTSNYKYLYIGIMTMIFTALIYRNRSIDISENFEEKIYVRPTRNNPFMNILQDDYVTRPTRESLNKANSYVNKDLNKYIDTKYSYNLYKDADDIFDRNTTQRQFYTMPVTTIPNEQTKFAKWLYGRQPTCKEGNGNQCVANNYNYVRR